MYYINIIFFIFYNTKYLFSNFFFLISHLFKIFNIFYF